MLKFALRQTCAMKGVAICENGVAISNSISRARVGSKKIKRGLHSFIVSIYTFLGSHRSFAGAAMTRMYWLHEVSSAGCSLPYLDYSGSLAIFSSHFSFNNTNIVHSYDFVAFSKQTRQTGHPLDFLLHSCIYAFLVQ